jgi:Flp pilus assembly secretin CpaC
MINIVEPKLLLSRVGDGATVISGFFKDPHTKRRIYNILENTGIDMKTLMDVTQTNEVNKMVRTKLYLVEINNQKAKDLGGVTGIGFFSQYLNVAVNPLAKNTATFSGWLLDNAGAVSAQKGNSVGGTLNFLQQSGIGTILDDTVLMTTEDENASFRVGGEVYIPIGISQNAGFAPTIQLEEREYGLELSLNSKFMEKDGFIHINVNIVDSEFDTNIDHEVNLGDGVTVPGFISKTIKTNVVVESGQVIVLGGRLHTEDYDTEEKIPFLGDLPWIGELFTHTISVKKKNDLLFFLVPEIVDANENIDDRKFYKNFSKEASSFHKEVYTLENDSKNRNENNISSKESLVIIEPKNEEENKVVVIEVEERKENKKVVSKPVEKSVYDEVIEEEKIVKSKKEKQNQVVSKVKKELDKKTKYEVTKNKIFLRNRPVDGRRDKVWVQGHKFTISDKKVIDGVTWMKIKDNCFKECVPTTKELWISENVSKKYN